MKRTTITAEELFAWAKLNGVEFHNVDVNTDLTRIDGASKGAGLVSTRDHSAIGIGNGAVLLSVPRDLILSRAQVERYATIDKHLKSVLVAADTFGRVST
jgi:hypothetical protein